jgi:hypothetical protein
MHSKEAEKEEIIKIYCYLFWVKEWMSEWKN